MNIQNELKQLDLTKTEILLYLYLLESGLSTPPQIAKGTGIARTNTYNVLQSLIGMGLIEEHLEGHKRAYIARDPQALLDTLNRKKEALTRVLPDLRALHVTQKNKPKIRFNDGWESVKEIYRQSTVEKELFAIGSTKRLVELDETFFSEFEKSLLLKGTILHDIVTASSREVAEGSTSVELKGLYDLTVLPPEYGEMATDILIWGDNVALISLQEPIFGTIITSPAIAESFRLVARVMSRSLQS